MENKTFEFQFSNCRKKIKIQRNNYNTIEISRELKNT